MAHQIMHKFVPPKINLGLSIAGKSPIASTRREKTIVELFRLKILNLLRIILIKRNAGKKQKLRSVIRKKVPASTPYFKKTL